MRKLKIFEDFNKCLISFIVFLLTTDVSKMTAASLPFEAETFIMSIDCGDTKKLDCGVFLFI